MLDDQNEGYKMLKGMGWREGSGLEPRVLASPRQSPLTTDRLRRLALVDCGSWRAAPPQMTQIAASVTWSHLFVPATRGLPPAHPE